MLSNEMLDRLSWYPPLLKKRGKRRCRRCNKTQQRVKKLEAEAKQLLEQLKQDIAAAPKGNDEIVQLTEQMKQMNIPPAQQT